jgi:Rieske Fe-S protein
MSTEDSTTGVEMPRRRLLVWLSTFAMGAGLLASYGTLAAFLGRFLYPARPAEQGWMFVIEVAGMQPGGSLVYRTPTGSPVSVTRQGTGSEPSDFVALSSTCPHLGCQVHWESQNSRFFCPCHNGVFDPSGKATEGPPADVGQSLLEYPLQVSDGMLFIRVPVEQLAGGGSGWVEPGWETRA